MKLLSKWNCLLGLLFFCASVAAPTARAFSLLGPLEPWMNITNGFYPGADPGGPKTIGEGYRWNVPVLTYGFDQSFLNYFGTNGVAAVESAISVLNNLPPASQLNPANFASDTTYGNSQASALNLIDLKSEALYLLLQHLGLASPDKFVYTLKNFTLANGTVDGQVVQRNYDPLTYLPSDSVNGVLFSYYLAVGRYDGITNAVAENSPVNPLAPYSTAVANGFQTGDGVGNCYGGLTEDDAGGLCYLYATNNIDFETLPPDVQAAGGAHFVNGTLRLGVNKLTFIPQPVDAVTGAFLPVTNAFTDHYVTNDVVASQALQRVTVQPDFLFSVSNVVSPGNWYTSTGTSNWINYGLLNMGGPGVIAPPVHLTFAALGPWWNNVSGSGADAAALTASTVWGTFDGTTNAPIIYPQPGRAATGTPVLLTVTSNNHSVSYPLLATGTNAFFSFQTSSNLTTWSTLFTITNNGALNTYFNPSPTAGERFYRVVPQ